MTETENTNNPIVWVVQEGQNDYSSAEEFGEVRFVTRSEITKFKDSAQNATAEGDLRKFLSNYVPGVDLIIPSGNPVLVALAMVSLPSGTHNILKWDGRRAVYIPFQISAIK